MLSHSTRLCILATAWLAILANSRTFLTIFAVVDMLVIVLLHVLECLHLTLPQLDTQSFIVCALILAWPCACHPDPFPHLLLHRENNSF